MTRQCNHAVSHVKNGKVYTFMVEPSQCHHCLNQTIIELRRICQALAVGYTCQRSGFRSDITAAEMDSVWFSANEALVEFELMKGREPLLNLRSDR